MAKWTKTAKAAAVVFTLFIPAGVAAATIYGTISQGNQPVANAPVVLVCGGSEAAKATTDARGTYRLTTGKTGRCNLKIGVGSTDVILYQDPTRYDFEITGAGPQTRLNRR
ncbi:MAG TPA: hypothetical protein VGL11_07005 [Candidatus Binatia bacterium]